MRTLLSLLLLAAALILVIPAWASDASLGRLLPGLDQPSPNMGSAPMRIAAQQDAAPYQRGSGMPSGFLGSIITGQEFTGLNILDFIAIGVVIFFLARFMGSRGPKDSERPPLDEQSDAFQNARRMWNRFQDKAPGTDQNGDRQRKEYEDQPRGDRAPGPDNVVDIKPRPAAAPEPPNATMTATGAASVPAGFDVREFMEGAKLVFARLQDSLAHGDLEDIGQFSAGNALSEFSQRVQTRGPGAPVDITRLNARLLEVKDEGSTREAAVAFDGVLSRRGPGRNAQGGSGREAVREVWRFRKDVRQKDAMWLLEEVEPLQ